VALSMAAIVQGAPTPDILVKTTVFNTDATGTSLRVQSDDAQEDIYQTTTVGGKTTVTSKIYSFTGTVGQDFFLTTYYPSKSSYAASGRTVKIDLSNQLSSGAFLTPNLGSGLVPVQIGVKCRLATPNPVSLVGMTLNQPVECPGSLRFWAPDGQWYRFSFQPEKLSNSDRWKVTCIATGSGCTKWTITPSGSDGMSVNTLLHIDDQGTILDVGGDYGLTYSFLVER
jgi:hypothetical protein